MREFAAIVVAVVLGTVGANARAAELRIAPGAEITSADPHFHSFFPNNNLDGHVFDPLIRQDHQQHLVPAPAVSWMAIENVPTDEVECLKKNAASRVASTESGWGASNVGRYSNPTFDALLRQVFATIDRPARERLLQQASALSITDQAFVPLHFQVDIWAMTRDVTYKARSDEYTLALEFQPAK